MRVDQNKDLKGKDKNFQDIYKSREYAQEVVATVDSKHLIAKHALVEAEAIKDKALTKVTSLESECKHLA